MDSREQLLAVSLTIMNVTWYRYSSKSIGCLPGMYLLHHTERVERLIYTQVDTPGNEFGKGIIKCDHLGKIRYLPTCSSVSCRVCCRTHHEMGQICRAQKRIKIGHARLDRGHGIFRL